MRETPTARDVQLAKEWVEDGWLSVSAKQKLLARPTEEMPLFEDIVKSEVLDTEDGKVLEKMWFDRVRGLLRHSAQLFPRHMRVSRVSTIQLTPTEYSAFRKLGGRSA